jgi:DNA-binding NtrC family response regulator
VVKPVSILIADSSADTRQRLVAKLKEDDPTLILHQSISGQETVRQLCNKKPDIAFISIDLADLSGAEALAHARKKGVSPFTILTSGRIMAHWAALAKEVGAYEFLRKPLDFDHAASIVSNYRRIHNPTSVLVVDGGKSSRIIVRRMLDKSLFNLDIHETDTAQHALKIIKLQTYDLLVIDVASCGMHGLELACQMQLHQRDCKVLLLAQPNSASLAHMGSIIGVPAILHKPFYTYDVDAALHSLFSLRRPYLLNAAAPATVKAVAAWG